MNKILVAIAFVFGVISNPVTAAEKDDFHLDSTEDLVDLCMVQAGQPYSVEAIHFCEGFIAGAIRYHDHVVGKNMKRIICYPEGTTRNDAIRVISKWGQANKGNAALMKDPAVYGWVRALQSEWPCEQ